MVTVVLQEIERYIKKFFIYFLYLIEQYKVELAL